jgi:hypothetical protein
MTWLTWILLTVGNGLNTLMKPTQAREIFTAACHCRFGAEFLFQLPLFAVQATTFDENLGICDIHLDILL